MLATALMGLWPASKAIAGTSSGCDIQTTQPLGALTEAQTDYRYNVRPLGTVRAVMIFVDFSDAPAIGPPGAAANLLVSGAAQWFAEASYGRMTLSITPTATWYRMPRPFSEYELHPGMSFAMHRAYVADAVAAADQDIDFSQYQITYIVPASSAPTGQSSLAFIAPAGAGVRADGIEVRFGATFQARVLWPTIVHETGHLLGLPDLYDVRSTFFVGMWDPMAGTTQGAGHFLGWHKRKLDWLDPTDVACLANPGQMDITLTPIEIAGGTKILVIRTGPSSVLVVEDRQALGQDTALCDKGVLVYRVDANVPTGAGPVTVVSAHPETTVVDGMRSGCGPLYNAPFDIGPNEVGTFTDHNAGITIQILASADLSYELQITAAAPATHAMRVSMRLTNHLTAYGTVMVADGYLPCRPGATVKIQRKSTTGAWVTVRSTVSGTAGSYRVSLPDRAGSYRALLPPTPRYALGTCLGTTSPTALHAH